jgi:hypothetical protein
MQAARFTIAALVACTPASRPPVTAPAAPEVRPAYLLLEPAAEPARRGELPVFRPLGARDPDRATVERVLARPYLRWLLAIGDEAKRLATRRCGADVACVQRLDHPAYFVIVKGGNRPHQGFALATEGATRELRDAWYVEIDPDQASILIPHEYGHVMMFASLPGDLPQRPQTLPHTTGAITNDVVAFSEGWGIHFETLAGDRRDQAETYARWHRDAFAVGGPVADGDSMVPVTDLFNYAQTYRRYTAVKENSFAYLPRVQESYVRGGVPTADDVLARWTDTTSDPARVRSLAQMVASEGLVATLFYRLATAPQARDDREPALPDPKRYAAFFAAFAQVTEERATATPPVLVFLQALLEAAPREERGRIARIALEVLHYQVGVAEAPRLYAELHAAGHRVDKPAFLQLLANAEPELERAVARLVEHPESIAEVTVPSLWIENAALRIDVPVLGMKQRPLVFDLDTAPVELLMTIPGVRHAEALAIDDARRRRGFRSADDLKSIEGVRRETVDAVEAMQAAFASSHR